MSDAPHHAYTKSILQKKCADPLNPFLSSLMPTRSLQGIAVLCLLTGIVILSTIILKHSESIVNIKITSGIGRPEMIILPMPGFYKDNSDNMMSKKTPATFAISKTEITNQQFFLVAGGIVVKEPLQPVTKIEPSKVLIYCNLLSELESLESCYEINGIDVDYRLNCTGYRLPTHEEWEYATRADLDNSFWAVKSNLLAYGWFAENTQNIRDVGTRPANPWGLYDMTGNIWEMIYPFEKDEVYYSLYYYYFRGGSYRDSINDINIKKKNYARYWDRYNNVGFRII